MTPRSCGPWKGGESCEKKWMCAALAALLLCSLTACGKTEEPERQDIFAMDTYMSLAAYGDGAREALAAAAREINRLEQELSRTVSASDIYKLNDSGSAVVSEETAALLQNAMTYSAATGGLFDVTVAPLVSLWGITTDSPRVPSQSEIDALLPLVGSGHIHMDGNAVTLDSGCAVDLGGIAKGLRQRPGGAGAAAVCRHWGRRILWEVTFMSAVKRATAAPGAWRCRTRKTPVPTL